MGLNCLFLVKVVEDSHLGDDRMVARVQIGLRLPHHANNVLAIWLSGKSLLTKIRELGESFNALRIDFVGAWLLSLRATLHFHNNSLVYSFWDISLWSIGTEAFLFEAKSLRHCK